MFRPFYKTYNLLILATWTPLSGQPKQYGNCAKLQISASGKASSPKCSNSRIGPIARETSNQGRDGYRLRIGDHRVIFEIDQSGNPIIVTIMQVEKRNERTY